MTKPNEDTLYNDAAKTWRLDPTPDASATALTTFKPIIDSSIHRYVGKDSPLVRSRAKSLVLQGLSSYDPYQGPVRPYLMSSLQGLKRYAAQQQQMLAAPERVVLDSQRLHHATEQLRDELDREPSDLELADHSGLSVKRIGHVRRYQPGATEGQIENRQMMSEEDDSGDPAVARPGSPDYALGLLYYDLSPLDQLIVDHTLGRNGRQKLPTNVIAKKLRLSPGAISQRTAKIQQQLHELTDMGLF